MSELPLLLVLLDHAVRPPGRPARRARPEATAYAASADGFPESSQELAVGGVPAGPARALGSVVYVLVMVMAAGAKAAGFALGARRANLGH